MSIFQQTLNLQKTPTIKTRQTQTSSTIQPANSYESVLPKTLVLSIIIQLNLFFTPGYHINGYTYTDYKNAFFRDFLLRPYDHSWFFSFDQNCTRTIPGWFNEWWYWFGPADPIYPEEVFKTSYPFYKKHVLDQPVGPLNKIWFYIDMGIPWICSWHFTLAIALQDMPYSLL